MQATMSHTPRQLTPMASNKRKTRDEAFDFLKPSTTPKLAKPIMPRATAPAKVSKTVASQPAPADNKLLAGYLAHEFLTKGTLFGQPWDPASADALPVSGLAHVADLRRPMKQPPISLKGKAAESKPGEKRMSKRYAEVSDLLKGKNGAHIPGIVNPAQLARFLHIQ